MATFSFSVAAQTADGRRGFHGLTSLAGGSAALTIFGRSILNGERLGHAAMIRTLTPAIPPKMYRHFALVTVALTAGVAMFATGENREAVAAHMEEREQQQELQRKSREKFGTPKIGRSARPSRGRLAETSDGFDERFGQPTEKGTSSTGGVGIAAAEGTSPETQAGYSEQYLASLSAEERKLLLEGLGKEGLLSTEGRRRKTAPLIAESRRRSGGAPTND